MKGRQLLSALKVVLTLPEKVLLAEKSDPETFAPELCTLAAVKLYEIRTPLLELRG